MPVKIFLDTNVLMAVGQHKIDIFSEISRVCDFANEVVVIDKVIDELEGIKKSQKGKHRDAARLALDITKSKKLPITKTEKGSTDDCILEEAKRSKGIVATQDYWLKRRLKAGHIPVLVIRGRKYLSLLG